MIFKTASTPKPFRLGTITQSAGSVSLNLDKNVYVFEPAGQLLTGDVTIVLPTPTENDVQMSLVFIKIKFQGKEFKYNITYNGSTVAIVKARTSGIFLFNNGVWRLIK